MAKPKLFIASSWVAVQNNVVENFSKALRNDAACVCWEDEPEFKRGSTSNLQALIAAANRYDYAVFLFTPDDTLVRHGETKEYACPRDNVVFELGLFLSVLGYRHVFAYQQISDRDIWVLSDWSGIQIPGFEYPEDRVERLNHVNDVTEGLRTTIQDVGFRKMPLYIARRWRADIEGQWFRVRFDPMRIRFANISDYRVCVVARVKKEEIAFEEDEAIIKSDVRNVRADIQEELVIYCRGFEGEIKEGTTVEGAVILLPQDVEPGDFKTVDEARKLGCKDVQKPDYHF